jgi:uncharacterized protein (DUF433 family)
MSDNKEYKYLRPKGGGSNYRQLFVNGRIRAEVLYRETVGLEPLTPAEVAREYDVPVEAVLEAIDYYIKNDTLLNEERSREEAWIRANGRDKWPYAPPMLGVPDESRQSLMNSTYSIIGANALYSDSWSSKKRRGRSGRRAAFARRHSGHRLV